MNSTPADPRDTSIRVPSFDKVASGSYIQFMRSVGLKTLKNKLSEYIRLAAGGDRAPFRAAEKRYKSRFPPPDLSNVLDLATLDSSRSEELRVWNGSSDAVEWIKLPLKQNGNDDANGLRGQAFIVPRIPGAICTFTSIALTPYIPRFVQILRACFTTVIPFRS
jgi:alkylated DNA repair protein alkB family protein 1